MFYKYGDFLVQTESESSYYIEFYWIENTVVADLTTLIEVLKKNEQVKSCRILN